MGHFEGTITVDGVPFEVRFGGFDVPLVLVLAEGHTCHLDPWTYRDYLGALAHHTWVHEQTVELSTWELCGSALVSAGLEGANIEAHLPLALWWIAGGAEETPKTSPDGWVALGAGRVRLAPWTYHQRLTALEACLSADQASLELPRYADLMVRATLVERDPSSLAIDALDARDTRWLMEAVTRLNDGDAGLGRWPEVLANALARDCGRLGWTPTRLLEAPAAEVDRLLAALEPRPRAPEHPPAARRLLDLPGTTVIHLEASR